MCKQILCIYFLFVLIPCYFTQQEIQRCSLKDAECQKNFYQYVGRNFAKTGIPRLGIPVIDPYELYNVSLSFLGLNITLVEGTCTGIGDCIVHTYETDIENLNRTIEVTCDLITIKGHYTITTDSDAAPLFDNAPVSGDGQGSIAIEDWYMQLKYPFEIVKRKDGEIYLEIKYKESEYKTEVRGKVTFEADNIVIGGKQKSKEIIKYMNKHWKFISDTIAKPFFDKSMDYYYFIYGKFFNLTPARRYLSDDLSKYVKN